MSIFNVNVVFITFYRFMLTADNGIKDKESYGDRSITSCKY